MRMLRKFILFLLIDASDLHVETVLKNSTSASITRPLPDSMIINLDCEEEVEPPIDEEREELLRLHSIWLDEQATKSAS